MRRGVVTAMLGKPLTARRTVRSEARRRVTERLFVEMRADTRFADLDDETIRGRIDAFLDDEGFDVGDPMSRTSVGPDGVERDA